VWSDLDAARDGEAVYIAGGTEVLPLIRAGILRPATLIDLSRLGNSNIAISRPGVLAIGAFARLNDVARHSLIHAHAPTIAQALQLGASAQIRNMATVGGNLLQRTRCGYFRDPDFPCNKRALGSGCPAIEGLNRHHALFGSSPQCVAVHASDLAVVLAAMDATVRTRQAGGEPRAVPINDLYVLPGDRPDLETTLLPGEVITQIDVPYAPSVRSRFVKVRERALFDFALVSAAIALRLVASRIAEVRIALGGVSARPWRLYDAEQALVGTVPTLGQFRAVFASCGKDAAPLSGNAFKLAIAENLATRCIWNLVSCSDARNGHANAATD
jgi:xanthine dehydrogenase YagS FAD-binding subunit